MSIQPWQLYDFDAVETEFARIILAGQNPAVQVLTSRDPTANTTPRIQVVLNTQIGRYDGRLNPQIKNYAAAYQDRAIFQPINTWDYGLSVTVFTDRQNNSDRASEIIARVKASVLLPWIAPVWNAAIHYPKDVIEGVFTNSVEDVTNFDISALTFTGMLSIYDEVWSQLA